MSSLNDFTADGYLGLGLGEALVLRGLGLLAEEGRQSEGFGPGIV